MLGACAQRLRNTGRVVRLTVKVVVVFSVFFNFTKTVTSISQYHKQRKYTAEKEENKMCKDRTEKEKKEKKHTTTHRLT